MRLSQAEIYEVASFYDHFDVVHEGQIPPAPLTIRVCESISCMLAGSERLLDELAAGQAGQRPQQQRGEEQPAAETRAQRHRRSQHLQPQHRQDELQALGGGEVELQGAVAG